MSPSGDGAAGQAVLLRLPRRQHAEPQRAGRGRFDDSRLLARKRPASRVVLLIDACHSGGRSNPTSFMDGLGYDFNVTSISSSEGNKPSYELDDFQAGAFTVALKEAFSGKADSLRRNDDGKFVSDGYITMDEVISYLKERVPALTKDPARFPHQTTRPVRRPADVRRDEPDQKSSNWATAWRRERINEQRPGARSHHVLGRAVEGDDEAIQRVWERYYDRLVQLARRKLGPANRRAADEEDVAISAVSQLLPRRLRRAASPRLNDRTDLWKLLVTITCRKGDRPDQKRDRAKTRGAGGVRGRVGLSEGVRA